MFVWLIDWYSIWICIYAIQKLCEIYIVSNVLIQEIIEGPETSQIRPIEHVGLHVFRSILQIIPVEHITKQNYYWLIDCENDAYFNHLIFLLITKHARIYAYGIVLSATWIILGTGLRNLARAFRRVKDRRRVPRTIHLAWETMP